MLYLLHLLLLPSLSWGALRRTLASSRTALKSTLRQPMAPKGTGLKIGPSLAPKSRGAGVMQMARQQLNRATPAAVRFGQAARTNFKQLERAGKDQIGRLMRTEGELRAEKRIAEILERGSPRQGLGSDLVDITKGWKTGARWNPAADAAAKSDLSAVNYLLTVEEESVRTAGRFLETEGHGFHKTMRSFKEMGKKDIESLDELHELMQLSHQGESRLLNLRSALETTEQSLQKTTENLMKASPAEVQQATLELGEAVLKKMGQWRGSLDKASQRSSDIGSALWDLVLKKEAEVIEKGSFTKITSRELAETLQLKGPAREFHMDFKALRKDLSPLADSLANTRTKLSEKFTQASREHSKKEIQRQVTNGLRKTNGFLFASIGAFAMLASGGQEEGIYPGAPESPPSSSASPARDLQKQLRDLKDEERRARLLVSSLENERKEIEELEAKISLFQVAAADYAKSLQRDAGRWTRSSSSKIKSMEATLKDMADTSAEASEFFTQKQRELDDLVQDGKTPPLADNHRTLLGEALHIVKAFESLSVEAAELLGGLKEELPGRMIMWSSEMKRAVYPFVSADSVLQGSLSGFRTSTSSVVEGSKTEEYQKAAYVRAASLTVLAKESELIRVEAEIPGAQEKEKDVLAKFLVDNLDQVARRDARGHSKSKQLLDGRTAGVGQLKRGLGLTSETEEGGSVEFDLDKATSAIQEMNLFSTNDYEKVESLQSAFWSDLQGSVQRYGEALVKGEAQVASKEAAKIQKNIEVFEASSLQTAYLSEAARKADVENLSQNFEVLKRGAFSGLSNPELPKADLDAEAFEDPIRKLYARAGKIIGEGAVKEEKVSIRNAIKLAKAEMKAEGALK